ncbi:glycosyl transferase [Pseudonocardia sulfidoxydans NBRC 16205]|uniref:Glycosyl transferase n=1 Tax=Pseudonocardia sulfidoxydans NBRC 16205 TaxID=1223511 RepID=A0A511DDQ4_9PSEU|nr:glycosyltransferase family 4 protein [Pseudonocardia sulfidoxydans]GEL21814.1 glycosyl transferase [Pseudonocardia sulfidoxydans NBRC 16205]
MNRAVTVVVLPAGVDDPARPSGGNVYDRRLCTALAANRPLCEIEVDGTWPRPEPAARTALASALAAIPAGTVVVLDGLVACGVPEVVVPHSARLRLVVLVHLPLGDEAGAAPGLAAAERRVLHAAAAVVTTSAWTARRVVEGHGLPAARVHVAEPGADPAPLAAGSGDGGSLLCLGAVTPTKGQDVLVEALAAVADRRWTCRVGGPLDRAPAFAHRVRERARVHGLAERVSFDGPLAGRALDAAFDGADLLVLPSRTEAFGMVVREAAARAIPVLATDAGGVGEALGEGGLLVEPGDARALARGLRRWFDDAGLRHALRRSAMVARFAVPGWDRTAARVAAVLDALAPAPALLR